MNLVKKIKEAFEWRTRPTVDELITSTELTYDEVDSVMHIGKNDWYHVTADDWETYSEAYSFLSPSAFCYYLPSMLKVTIEDNNPNLLVTSHIIQTLDRSPLIEWWDEWFYERFTLLTQAELDVLQEWVIWLSSFENNPFSDITYSRALDTLSLLEQALYLIGSPNK